MIFLEEFFKDKKQNTKAKVESLSEQLIKGLLKCSDLISFAQKTKDSEKGTIMEALEFSSRQNPEIIDEKTFDFVVEGLTYKAPRVKWEAAKVIRNVASLHTKKLDKAINLLLTNTEDKGTVVRWAAAFALCEIVKLKTNYQKELIPALKAIVQHEEKASIKKIYMNVLKLPLKSDL